MEKSILIRSLSGESETAKSVLKKSKIPFIEVFAETDYSPPKLIAVGSCFAYNGLASIKQYASTHKSEIRR
jgi:hypothetical protein